MRIRFVMGLAALVVSAFVGVGITFAADSVKSGLQVGASAGAFNVQDITGPNKGTSLCYR